MIMNLKDKTSAIKKFLEKKEITYPVNLAASVVCFIFAIIVLNIIPKYIQMSKDESIDGTSFPKLLMYIIIGCSIVLAAIEVKKIIRKETLVYQSLNLFVELKVFIILLLYFIFYLLNVVTNIFLIGASFFSIGFLIFFKCKKKRYYIITLVCTLAIWLLFRFFLNVRL